ncbi:MAG: hypothetical protein ACW99U_08605 [Candidatus Thorarchaeota archaeon]|jgi:hypothetical protein
MVLDITQQEYSDAKQLLEALVVEKQVSSIEVMSTEIGIDNENTRLLLEELVADGRIHGRISENGERFFKSAVRMSGGRVIPSHSMAASERADSRKGKYAILGGIVTFIVGQVFPDSLWSVPLIGNLGIIFVFAGMAMILAGLFHMSQE